MRYNELVMDSDFNDAIQHTTSFSGVRDLEKYTTEGRWWMVESIGQSLITTSKTQMGVKVLALLGISSIQGRHLDVCDECYGYSFKCAGQEDGPTDSDGEMVPVVWFCHDCIEKRNA